MPRRRTRGEIEIESRLKTMDPESSRYRVLAAARDFKASWVALGAQLTRVREDGSFTAWGYSSFEAYCRRELRLRQDTANKLTRSFAFIRDHEPDALAERDEHELPPLDVVDLLTRARDKASVTDDDLASIRQEVFEPDAHPTRHQVIKRFREIDPDAFRAKPRIVPDEPEEAANDSDAPVDADEVRKALVIAERLLDLVRQNPGVSSQCREGMKLVVAELSAQQESLRRKSA